MTEPRGVRWSVGRGIADVTGEPWGVGMMGYGLPDQWTCGIATRQYARAFVFDDGRERVVFVVADIGMFFQAAVDAIHARLNARLGDRYTPGNTVLTATHTHCGPGGHGHHLLYNVTTKGFHRRTFDRLVGGVVEAIEHADADLATADVTLSRGELHDASANRAKAAFDENPADDRAPFPEGIDPQALLLRVEREGRLAAAVHWFGVHNTSMTNRNRLIHADNKGLAALTWERETPGLIAAFAQTNAGDLSPNLDLQPGTGPTSDEWENTRIIGERQRISAQELAREPGQPLEPLVDARFAYVDFDRADGPEGATGRAVLGASFAAGKLTDGPGSPWFDEGRNNPIVERISQAVYRFSASLEQAHAPKDLLLPIGAMRWCQQRFGIQLVRLGGLYLVCVPFEVTVVAALRLRRRVAEVLGVGVDQVVCQGYANGYGHYVTTPEEYDLQLYEAGSTIFGRHQLAVLTEAAADLARALVAGEPIDPGRAPDPVRLRPSGPTGAPVFSRRRRLAVRDAPPRVRAGDALAVTFDADHPNRSIETSYVQVERRAGSSWEPVADDADPATTVRWSRDRRMRFTAEVTWLVPADFCGTVRVGYHGTGTVWTDPIEVTPAAS